MDNAIKIDNKNIETAIEAILFAAGHPVSYAKLGEVLDYSEAQIKRKVIAFASKYNENDKRGIMLLAFESSCQLCTREEFLPYIKDALGIRKGGNLSNSSLEVLAIIAYNQPTTRAFVDDVRGVDSTYIMGSLLEKNLIEVCGRLDVPGRPNLYKTTDTFLRCFGIESLEQLPYVEIQRAENEGEIIPLDVEYMPAESEGAVISSLENEDDASEKDSESDLAEGETASDEETSGEEANFDADEEDVEDIDGENPEDGE